MIKKIKTSRFKKLFVHTILFLLLFLPPLYFNSTEIYAITTIEDITSVLPKIFSNDTFKHLPILSLVLKGINCLSLILFLFWKKMRKHFNIYVFIYMMCITLTQNVAYIEQREGFVLSSGSFVLMLATCFIWLFKIRKEEQHFTVNKNYLWMLTIVIICIWYPLDRSAQFDFSLNPYIHYLSSSMYCFNMPVFISFLLIFYKKNSGVFYEAIGWIALMFSIITIFANLRTVNHLPNCIMHFPLLVSALTLLFNCSKEHKKKHHVKTEKIHNKFIENA